MMRLMATVFSPLIGDFIKCRRSAGSFVVRPKAIVCFLVMFLLIGRLPQASSQKPRPVPMKPPIRVHGVDTQGLKAGRPIVCVIDTGVDYTHDLLWDKMWVNERELNGFQNIDDDGNGYLDDINGYDFVDNDGDPQDTHFGLRGHGTYMAATIGGLNRASKVDTDWSPLIMACRFTEMEFAKNWSDGLSSCIQYCVANGARLLNFGFGLEWYNIFHEENVLRAFNLIRLADALFIASAGGYVFGTPDVGQKLILPHLTNIENTVIVASVDSQYKLSEFSAYGDEVVHLGAFGEQQYTPLDVIPWTGTDAAVPHVTRVASLLLKNRLHRSAKNLKYIIDITVMPSWSLQQNTIWGGALNEEEAVKEARFVDEERYGWHYDRKPDPFSSVDS